MHFLTKKLFKKHKKIEFNWKDKKSVGYCT
jgi:hypothetical protein